MNNYATLIATELTYFCRTLGPAFGEEWLLVQALGDDVVSRLMQLKLTSAEDAASLDKMRIESLQLTLPQARKLLGICHKVMARIDTME